MPSLPAPLTQRPDKSQNPESPDAFDPSDERQTLLAAYRDVRGQTERLCAPLEVEDYVIQPMPDASPAKWHIAHTSWFFETFVLKTAFADYASPHSQYDFLFNSYYNAVGARHERQNRGLISRPSVAETFRYRAHVDTCMNDLLLGASEETLRQLAPIITLGLHHEQQHQELLVTDIKYTLSCNPLQPGYFPHQLEAETNSQPALLNWIAFPEGVMEIGHRDDGFCFDNEEPRHRRFVNTFELASRLVTNHEYLDFMRDGGYERPEFWLSAGWNAVGQNNWRAPLYWEENGDAWRVFTLGGLKNVAPDEPVCHISLFEADAFARWAGSQAQTRGARLPTEAEWECACPFRVEGNLAESGLLHPTATPFEARGAQPETVQMFGDVWEWTRSQYEPYPGYAPAAGALGEYNGKFMCNQFVLRGGSCATSQSHIRASYRNFFPPDARWQFSGIRLARD